MARSYGQIMSAIWNDPEFRAIDGAAQRVYLMLVTQSEITSAGTIALTVKRWSQYASDTPSDALSDALSRLEVGRFVVIDWENEELLVRSFVKWDGGANNEKRRPAIKAAANAVVSPKIRAVLKTELDKLHVPHDIADSPSDSHPDSPRVVVTEVGTTHNPQPTTQIHNPGAVAQQAPSPTRRATRISATWAPEASDITWARAEGFSDDVAKRETFKFVNYWMAKSGKDATKLDWSRTWQNWMLKLTDDSGGHRPPAASPASSKARGWLELGNPTEPPALEGIS
jgi:hypothetical protein